MTSSLVGSEMCIRDRFLVWDPGPKAMMDQQPHRPPDQGHVQGQGQLPNPVSYTHLTLPTICSV
eukprot:8923126-Prorocentrum_lima.AAC.1